MYDKHMAKQVLPASDWFSLALNVQMCCYILWYQILLLRKACLSCLFAPRLPEDNMEGRRTCGLKQYKQHCWQHVLMFNTGPAGLDTCHSVSTELKQLYRSLHIFQHAGVVRNHLQVMMRKVPKNHHIDLHLDSVWLVIYYLFSILKKTNRAISPWSNVYGLVM